MVYRSPTNTACQLPHSWLIVYRSPATTACQLPQVTNCHPACQLSHSSLRKPTSVRSHRQSPAMNATTASFLGLRQRQRAQDLLREAPRKAPRKALKRVPASQCTHASQKGAIRIAAIASVHINCTAHSLVTLIHCIAHQLLVNLVARAVLAMFAPPAKEALA